MNSVHEVSKYDVLSNLSECFYLLTIIFSYYYHYIIIIMWSKNGQLADRLFNMTTHGYNSKSLDQGSCSCTINFYVFKNCTFKSECAACCYVNMLFFCVKKWVQTKKWAKCSFFCLFSLFYAQKLICYVNSLFLCKKWTQLLSAHFFTQKSILT